MFFLHTANNIRTTFQRNSSQPITSQYLLATISSTLFHVQSNRSIPNKLIPKSQPNKKTKPPPKKPPSSSCKPHIKTSPTLHPNPPNQPNNQKTQNVLLNPNPHPQRSPIQTLARRDTWRLSHPSSLRHHRLNNHTLRDDHQPLCATRLTSLCAINAWCHARLFEKNTVGIIGSSGGVKYVREGWW